jgi:TamB, inner membrane protein subunit of TAM complex
LSQTSVTNNLYEKVGDIFGSVFKNSDDKFSFGVDIVSAERTLGREADGRIGLTFSTKINDRVSFNGKFGVPVGGISESAVFGDVEVQYRVNEDGTLNLRAFNKENDINYVGQGIAYTQGLGISYDVDFDTFKELVEKIFKNQKIEKEKKSEKENPDNEFLPDYINLNDKDKKKTDNPKPNADAVPTKD